MICAMDLEKFKKYVEESTTYADVCRKIGWKPTGGNYRYVKRYIKELGLDISHFTGKKTNIGNRLGNNEKDINEYLTKDSFIKPSYLKWKLFSSGLKQHKCEKCGCTRWNGEQISLQLHHINGDNTDNRLENLQILCPNCHSQTDNFCGTHNIENKNSQKHYYCRMCGKEIDKTQSLLCDECYDKLSEGIVEFGFVKRNKKDTIRKIESLIKRKHKKGTCEKCGCSTSSPKIKLCSKCYHETRRKVSRPSKEELISLLEKNNFSKVGRIFGVSDTAIRKWCKGYGILCGNAT